jgi:hypothetical protein
MPEWWTYTLADFLMFSPRTWYRLIERYNASVWPVHLLLSAAGAGLLVRTLRPSDRGRHVTMGVLALAWGWVAWAFLWRRYAEINWAAWYLAGAFLLEALLLAGVGGRLRPRIHRGRAKWIGVGLVALALLYPLLAPLSGRGWGATEVLGLMPEPTAIASLGWLLAHEGRGRGVLLVIPMLWCVIGGLTLYALGAAEAAVPAAAVLLTLVALARPGPAT